MQYTLALLGLVAAVSAVPQGVTSAIAPSSSPPAGCQSSYSGSFEIQTVNVTSSPSKQKRQADVLTLTLSGGILTDAKGRTGYIAANQQFQFDSPPQTGAIYTAGWSVCSNGTLAIGGSAIFYQCLSGDFYNLYADSQGAQCSQIYIEVIPGAGATPAATQLSDGQPQATPAPLCQISDGQPQQGTSCLPVTQISDGQIQATTAVSPVTQISDGQVQNPTGVVTQISDGQPQAPSAKAPVTQISDGQVQAPAPTNPVGQISDGQIIATSARASAASTRPPGVQYTGAAVNVRGEYFGLAAGVLAVALL